MKNPNKRKFEATIIFEVETPTLKEGMQVTKDTLESLRLKVKKVKPMQDYRTEAQNNALHLWFDQLSEELKKSQIPLQLIFKQGFELEPTPEAIKEFIWRPTQKAMFGKKSTTKLWKTGEIDAIYDAINRAIVERTSHLPEDRRVIVPPFPNIDALIDRDNNY